MTKKKPKAGIEPATFALRVRRNTTMLFRLKFPCWGSNPGRSGESRVS